MKSASQTFVLTNSHIDDTGVTSASALDVTMRPLERTLSRHSRSDALRLVGLMAFGQSLLFLAIWLLICASAGAAGVKNVDFNRDLQLSEYQPAKARDPFGGMAGASANVEPTPIGTLAFQLQGILYQTKNPSAIVNNQLLTLNKTVTLETGIGTVEVRAIEITRNLVVLESRGQKVKLQLNSSNSQH